MASDTLEFELAETESPVENALFLNYFETFFIERITGKETNYSRDALQWTAIQWTISRIRASTEKAIEWTFFSFFFYIPENNRVSGLKLKFRFRQKLSKIKPLQEKIF